MASIKRRKSKNKLTLNKETYRETHYFNSIYRRSISDSNLLRDSQQPIEQGKLEEQQKKIYNLEYSQSGADQQAKLPPETVAC